MNLTFLKKLFSIILIIVPIASFSFESLPGSNEVQDWWIQCHGDDSASTCLTDHELAKFKAICSNKIYKADCGTVVNHAVAKARLAEGIKFFASEFKNQELIFSMPNSNSVDIEKHLGKKVQKSFQSFTAAILPNCGASRTKKLHFNNQVKADTKATIQNIYEQLVNKPCDHSDEDFVLVFIGQVHDSSDAFEVFTLDQKNKIHVLSTAIASSPFVSENSTTASFSGSHRAGK